MADDVTIKMLLEHMQAMEGRLLTQIGGLGKRLGGVEQRLTALEERVDRGFEDARRHRESLQEDLDATIRLQGKHSATLTRLARAGSR